MYKLTFKERCKLYWDLFVSRLKRQKFKPGEAILYNLTVCYVIGRWGSWGTSIETGAYVETLDEEDLKVAFPLTRENLKKSWGFISVAEELCSYYLWPNIHDLWRHRAVIRRAWELALLSDDPKYAEKQQLNIFKYHKVIMNRRKK